MIQRAVTSIIGVVLGLFATFAVFGAILAGLDSFYLLTQDACNYGSENAPRRVLRVAPEVEGRRLDADAIDWTRDGQDLEHDGDGGCALVGDRDASATYLAPNGDAVELGSSEGSTETISLDLISDRAAVLDDDRSAQIEQANADVPLGRYDSYIHDGILISLTEAVPLSIVEYDLAAGTWVEYDVSTFVSGFGGIWATDDSTLVVDASFDELLIFDRADYAVDTTVVINLAADHGNAQDTYLIDDTLYVQNVGDATVFAYDIVTGNYDDSKNFEHPRLAETGVNGMWSDGTYLMLNDTGDSTDSILEVYLLADPQNLLFTVSFTYSTFGGIFLDADYVLYNFNSAFTIPNFSYQNVVDTGAGAGALTWIPAENVFTAQRQLVTLLAVIAAIGMPVGAMTAIVFFGQAVISSGVSGQGASQVLVAIAAVVIILVAVQMFQQFATYLGDAFDAVNGDRFVVFDETLGSLAETIAEFWGVLAFAGLINIATIVWRNYSGNFNIGGTQGGL